MIGGAFLSYEGFEKLAHKYLHSKEEDEQHHAEHVAALANPQVDMVAAEKEKIKGAVRTDFILSAEIIVISLGTVAAAPFGQQVAVLVTIAVAMTVGVYGLVAGIVKLDDAGLYLSRKASGGAQALGKLLLALAPRLMKFLSVVGTAAMFMVGGGIVAHSLPALHHFSEGVAHSVAGVPVIGGVLAAIAPTVVDALAGVLIGAAVLLVVTIAKRMFGKKATAHS